MLIVVFCLELDIIRNCSDYWRYDIWSRFPFTLRINMTQKRIHSIATRNFIEKETSARAMSVGRQKHVPLD
jgi:hypothetical protein